MSQKKTQYPGMDNNAGSNSYNIGFNAYGEDVQVKSSKRGTRFPGVENSSDEWEDKDNHDPIVGFLYSVSRTPFGEYWPLYVGKNQIGRDRDENTVFLPEGSVSGDHAILVIQQFTNPNKTFATLKDNGSKTGTFINGEPLVFGRSEKCKNGDILRFGGNYECMLILFDVRELGLKPSESFIPIEDDNDSMFEDDDPYKRDAVGKRESSPFENGGTRPMDGGKSYSGSQRRKTEGM